jgi:hypothetical protein
MAMAMVAVMVAAISKLEDFLEKTNRRPRTRYQAWKRKKCDRFIDRSFCD